MSGVVVAFVDESPAASPVLAMASVLGRVLDASVRATHVGNESGSTLASVAEAAGIPLETIPGDPTRLIVARLADPDVRAAVIGSRRHPVGPRPVGHIAFEVITEVDTLVAVVPPDAKIPAPGALDRILVPLDGTEKGATAVVQMCDTFAERGVEIIVVHVFDEETTPRFWEHPQYDREAFGEAFLARFMGDVEARFTLRTGPPQHGVVSAAETEEVDLIALGWSRSLDPGRAEVVRRVLSETPIPVLLVPVDGRLNR
ncbi:MAG: universal stress protein [Acidimicrobiia bacterium]